MRIGCFDLELLSGGATASDAGRWKVTNRNTGIPHVTYGTKAEVEEQAKVQSEAWERKTNGVKKLGAGWRDTKSWSPNNKASR